MLETVLENSVLDISVLELLWRCVLEMVLEKSVEVSEDIKTKLDNE